jgi:uncharacterized protein involved in outer membrane biogenesis
MKKIVIGLAIVLILCIFLAALAPFLIDLNKHKGTILAKLKPHLPREVDFQNIELTILTGLGAEIQGLRVSDNPAFSHEDCLRLEGLQVRVQILPLLKGQIKVKKIVLKEPFVRLARNEKGQFSFDDVVAHGKKASKDKPQQEKTKTKGPGILGALLVNELEIRQGKILFQDEMLSPGARPIVIDALDLSAEDLSLTHPISFAVAANLMEAADQNFHFTGKIGPVGEDLEVEKMPLDIHLSLQTFPLESLKDRLPDKLPVKVLSGSLSINLEATGSLAKMVVSESDIDLQGMVFQDQREKARGEKSGALRCTLTHKMSLDYSQKQVSIESGAVSVNGNRLLVKGTVEDFLADPKWDVKVWTEGFKPNALMALFPMYTRDIPDEIQVKGPVQISLSSSGSKENLRLDMNADMNELEIKYKDLVKKSVGMPLSVTLKGDRKADHISLKELQLVLHHLKMTAPGEIMIKDDKPHFDFHIQTNPVSLQGWDALVPKLSPFHLNGALTLKSSFNGTPQDASFDLQVLSDRVGFKLPPSKDKKPAARPREGLVEAVNIQAQGTKKADDVRGSGKVEIKKGAVMEAPFQKLLLDLQFSRDQLKIAGLSLEAFQGTIQGSGTFMPKKGDWAFEPIFKGIQVGKALDSVSEYKDSFSGALSGHFQAQGTKGPDALAAMKAKGSFSLSKGELKNFNLAGSILEALFGLKGVAQFLGGQREAVTKQGATQFDSLEGKLKMTGKTFHFETLQLNNIRTSKATDSIASLKGKCSLDTKLLDLKGKLILSKRHSQELARKAEMLEALFDGKKRIVLPVTIKGTIKKPVPFLDEEYVLEALAKHYTQKAVDKGIKKLRKKFKLPKEAEELEKPVKKLLDGLFGK